MKLLQNSRFLVVGNITLMYIQIYTIYKTINFVKYLP